MTEKGKGLSRVLFAAYLAVLLWLCFGHFSDTPDVPRMILGIPTDKIVHFCLFFPFPLLAWLAFVPETGRGRRRAFRILVVFAAGCLLAAPTEAGQALLTTSRKGAVLPFRADLAALAVSTLLVLLFDLSKQR